MIDRPIFVIGTGRCGSTLLYRLLSYHPGTAWISHYTSYLPGVKPWAALARVNEVPGLRMARLNTKTRLFPQPTENYNLLRQATDDVFTLPRPLTRADVTPDARKQMRRMVQSHLTGQGKPRFLLKHTGFPRVAYLDEIFPDALFVHVVRDGRAVASSLCHVDWWAGEGSWGWGDMDEEMREEYLASGRHELILAAAYWKTLMRHLARARDDVPAERLLEVRYDQLISDSVGTMKRIAGFCQLDWHPLFARRVEANPITSNDQKWRKLLTTDEQVMVESSLHDELELFGLLN